MSFRVPDWGACGCPSFTRRENLGDNRGIRLHPRRSYKRWWLDWLSSASRRQCHFSSVAMPTFIKKSGKSANRTNHGRDQAMQSYSHRQGNIFCLFEKGRSDIYREGQGTFVPQDPFPRVLLNGTRRNTLE